jgi:hypothetical protein
VAARRTVKDVLVAALRKLERYGWIQDDSGNRHTGYCMTGAIHASTHNPDLKIGAFMALDAVVTKREVALLSLSPCHADRVQLFNDASKRRKQTILAIYRRAIKEVAA